MVTLWIGDFRLRQLQSAYKDVQQTAEYHYIIEDQAEYSWFCNSAIPQLQKMTLEESNIVIMLGFVDCIYSSVWSSFKVDKIAKQYAETINNFANEHANFNIYVCTIGPVDGNYPFAISDNEVITENKLTEQIILFNKTLKKHCTVKLIDINSYLLDTSFITHDGIRYTSDTCTTIHTYITSNFESNDSAYFLPRLQEPNQEVDAYLYWTSTELGGLNPFDIVQNNSVLPSCTAYAWGRFYEITDEEPKLSTGSADTWYSYKTTDGYQRGSEPRVGAVACWNNYVAIVEQVRDNGSIVTSESDWTTTATDIWQQRERTNDNGNWGQSNGTFQGFIYCPKIEIDTSPKISHFNVDKCSATEATISFLADNYKTINYKISTDGAVIKQGIFTEKTLYKTIELTSLIPDTRYTVVVEAQNKAGEKISRELSFSTELVHPVSIKGINFNMDPISGKFTLVITKPDSLGYLSTDSGYDIQLLVNNNVVKTIVENDATRNIVLTDFTLKSKFNYEVKPTDNIQIGVRVWVKNASGIKVYDSDTATTSRVICLLGKPVKVYLNK